MKLRRTDDVGVSDRSTRKIYHRLVERSVCRTRSQYAACTPDGYSFIDEVMSVRVAEKRGYRPCEHCKRKMEREK